MQSVTWKRPQMNIRKMMVFVVLAAAANVVQAQVKLMLFGGGGETRRLPGLSELF
jgi:hypothetical protein